MIFMILNTMNTNIPALYHGNEVVTSGQLIPKTDNLGGKLTTIIKGQRLKNLFELKKEFELITTNNKEKGLIEKIWLLLYLKNFKITEEIYLRQKNAMDANQIMTDEAYLKLKDTIINLSIKNNMITPWTNMIVVDSKGMDCKPPEKKTSRNHAQKQWEL